MSWTITPSWSPADADAATYISAVEAADTAAGQSGGLEERVKIAIDNFVLGCKADGIWTAIKASCILAGARTLNGALVPLAGGVAPTNNGPFVAGDYDRKTGLIGNGSSKYLDSNRNDTSDPQDDHHLSVYVSTLGTGPAMASAVVEVPGSSNIGATSTRSRNQTVNSYTLQTAFNGISRSGSSAYSRRSSQVTSSVTQISESSTNQTMLILRGSSFYGSHRISFYSIGEALDLAKLDGRVTDLINAIAAAIP